MKTERATAKMLVYFNAAEFIRGHGEEGGMEQEDYPMPIELYLAEAKKLADILDKKGIQVRKKYNITY